MFYITHENLPPQTEVPQRIGPMPSKPPILGAFPNLFHFLCSFWARLGRSPNGGPAPNKLHREERLE